MSRVRSFSSCRVKSSSSVGVRRGGSAGVGGGVEVHRVDFVGFSSGLAYPGGDSIHQNYYFFPPPSSTTTNHPNDPQRLPQAPKMTSKSDPERSNIRLLLKKLKLTKHHSIYNVFTTCSRCAKVTFPPQNHLKAGLQPNRHF